VHSVCAAYFVLPTCNRKLNTNLSNFNLSTCDITSACSSVLILFSVGMHPSFLVGFYRSLVETSIHSQMSANSNIIIWRFGKVILIKGNNVCQHHFSRVQAVDSFCILIAFYLVPLALNKLSNLGHLINVYRNYLVISHICQKKF
jgi:hypothetical protein